MYPEFIINRKLLAKLDIIPYPDKVLISKARRSVYYTKKNITKTLSSNPDRYYFNAKGIVIDRTTQCPVIKNKRLAGKPRYWKINFQQIWNQTITKQARANVTHKLENLVKSSLSKCPVITEFPIAIEIVIYDIDMPQDVNNRGVVYHKVFADMLTKLDKIPDDSTKYLNDAGRTIFVKVNDESQIGMQCLIFHNEIKLI